MRRRRAYPILTTAAFSALACPHSVFAQAVPNQCSGLDLPELQQAMELTLPIFTDDAMAGFRTEHGIATLPFNVEREVVTDRKTCSDIGDAALSVVNTIITPGAGTTKNHVVMQFFRIGSYYVAIVGAGQTFDGTDRPSVRGNSDSLIFDVEGLTFLGWVLG